MTDWHDATEPPPPGELVWIVLMFDEHEPRVFPGVHAGPDVAEPWGCWERLQAVPGRGAVALNVAAWAPIDPEPPPVPIRAWIDPPEPAGRAWFVCRCRQTRLEADTGRPVTATCTACGPVFAVPHFADDWTASADAPGWFTRNEPGIPIPREDR